MDEHERALCAVTTAWLEAGQTFGAWGCGQSALAAAFLVWPGVPITNGFAMALGAALMLGIAERWLALRLQLDARLFHAIAQGDIQSLSVLDGALGALGLRPINSNTRTLASRIVGTRRLLRRYTATLLAQALLLVAAFVQLHP